MNRTNGQLTVKAPAKRPVKAPTPRSTKREIKAKRMAAYILGSVGAAGLICSMSHMSDAIHACWGGAMGLAWCMSAVIDGGLLGCEFGSIVATTKASKNWMMLYCIVAVILSAVLNTMSVLMHAEGSHAYVGAVLGALTPALLYALLRAGVHIYMEA